MIKHPVLIEQPWSPADLQHFAPSAEARDELAALPDPHTWRLTVMRTLWLEPAHTPLLLVGLIVEGVQGYAMLLASAHAGPYALPLVYALRAMLQREAQRYRLAEITAATRLHFAAGHRFLRCLRFQPALTFFPEGPRMELFQRYVWIAGGH